MKRLESGRIALELGALSTADMTTGASLTKLMYLLGNRTDIDNVNKNFERNLAGEMSV